jgi:flagellar hook-basal body complex protein FliE
MQASAVQQTPTAVDKPTVTGDKFAGLLKNAVDSVNDVQATAGKMQTAFELGDPNIGLAQVMVASQKASLSFQAMTQVRNKLLEAYRDVMNMPV